LLQTFHGWVMCVEEEEEEEGGREGG